MPEPTPLELNPEKTWTYRICRGIVAGLAWVMFRPRVIGAENIPLEGPVLVAPIHRSNVDFAFTIFLSPRKVFFMAKDSLFRVPLLGPLLRRLGAFPVRRGSADRESLTLATEVLRRGQALILFPEGTRKFGLSVEPLHDGAMFIAGRTGAKVVPVGIGGSEQAMPQGAKVPRPRRITVVVGRPLDPPAGDGRVTRSAVAEKSEELRRALESTYREAMGL
jgi:1-acyl-sn-glycerol-3-phosphate acyltransferase